MKQMIWVLALLAVIVAGCSNSNGATGAQAASSYQAMSYDNGSQIFMFDGTNNQNLSRGVFTRSVRITENTEYALWLNCTGNVTTVRYQVSPDDSLWINGSVAVNPCLSNASRYEPSEKAFRYIRGWVQTGQTASNLTNISLLVTGK